MTSPVAYGQAKVNGSAVLPSQRPSTISFYTLTVPSTDITGQAGVVNGAFDQIFRTAVGTIATVAMIGTPVYGSDTVLPFAVEDTGVDSLSVTGLGLGNGSVTEPSTAQALRDAIRALGSTVGPSTVDLTGVTVATGIRGVAF